VPHGFKLFFAAWRHKFRLHFSTNPRAKQLLTNRSVKIILKWSSLQESTAKVLFYPTNGPILSIK
jgi:hypothetical protein